MRKLARKSMKELFELAEKERVMHPERSHRYVEIARNISMRTRTRIPRHFKRRFCNRCHRFLYGSNCRVRTKNKKVIIPTNAKSIIVAPTLLPQCEPISSMGKSSISIFSPLLII